MLNNYLRFTDKVKKVLDFLFAEPREREGIFPELKEFCQHVNSPNFRVWDFKVLQLVLYQLGGQGVIRLDMGGSA